jgi:hypothetical protein
LQVDVWKNTVCPPQGQSFSLRFQFAIYLPFVLLATSTAFSARKKIELFNQILCPQMRVAFEHLHRLVAADGGDFLIRESGFNKAADGLMA